MTDKVRSWIERLNLLPHPEGGYYREVYRSRETISPGALPARFPGPRALATSILYLLPTDEVSRFHRLRSDEVWHFYLGSRLTLAMIEADGRLVEIDLGPDTAAGESLQAVVPAGRWFGASVSGNGRFALVGCTLSPGFDAADFELGARRTLLGLYPRHESIILRLTR